MSAALASVYPPQEALWDLERLDVQGPFADNGLGGGLESGQVDWQEVHRIVQRPLSRMARRIQRDHPEIRARCGKTSSRESWLFSYCEFDVPADHGIEGIGVGVLLQHLSGNRVVVQGDIVRDETGEILFTLDDQVVVNQRPDVIAAAQEAARQLGTQVGCVVDGLQQPCFPDPI